MAAITNGFTTKRVTLTADTEQTVMFPGFAREVAVVNMGAGTVYVKKNGIVEATTDTGANVLDTTVRGVTLDQNDRSGPISFISLFCHEGGEVQWEAR
jgi:hypothetical protein